MPPVVTPGDASGTHTSTDQWQGFEMRMRQRRIARLLLRADVALEAGAMDAAREVLEELDRLNAEGSEVAELRARIGRPALDKRTPEIESTPVVIGPADHAAQKRRGMPRVATAALTLVLITWFARSTDSPPPAHELMQQATNAPAVPEIPTQPNTAITLPPVQVVIDELPAANIVVEPPPVIRSPQQPAVATVGREIASPRSTAAFRPAREEIRPLPAPKPPANSSPVASNPREVVATPPPFERPPPEPPLVSAPAVASLPTAASPPIAAPADAALPLTPPVASENTAVRSTLANYESAYSRLDVDAAHAVWPGVDRRALARAFDGLTSQRVNLGSCDVRIVGETALAECLGSATWTPKIGGGSHTQRRRWQFRLRNASGEWQIVAATVR